jgi:hypothetical protein
LKWTKCGVFTPTKRIKSRYGRLVTIKPVRLPPFGLGRGVQESGHAAGTT